MDGTGYREVDATTARTSSAARLNEQRLRLLDREAAHSGDRGQSDRGIVITSIGGS